MNKHWWLYVLRLEQRKWYVGITSQTPEKRFEQHMYGIWAAEWTKVYKPTSISIAKDLGHITREEAEAIEHENTKALMRERGWQNVRGGRFCSIEYKKRFGTLWRVNTEKDMPTIGMLHAIQVITLLLLVILYLLVTRSS